jgi:enhancer of polycomb-like protein
MEKVLQQALALPHTVYSKIIPEIYQFWIAKRNRLRKPCCRKYWPQTPASDTNPHMVFRPREKERYRLRKHRKNDLDSYRFVRFICAF